MDKELNGLIVDVVEKKIPLSPCNSNWSVSPVPYSPTRTFLVEVELSPNPRIPSLACVPDPEMFRIQSLQVVVGPIITLPLLTTSSWPMYKL